MRFDGSLTDNAIRIRPIIDEKHSLPPIIPTAFGYIRIDRIVD